MNQLEYDLAEVARAGKEYLENRVNELRQADPDMTIEDCLDEARIEWKEVLLKMAPDCEECYHQRGKNFSNRDRNDPDSDFECIAFTCPWGKQ